MYICVWIQVNLSMEILGVMRMKNKLYILSVWNHWESECSKWSKTEKAPLSANIGGQPGMQLGVFQDREGV